MHEILYTDLDIHELLYFYSFARYFFLFGINQIVSGLNQILSDLNQTKLEILQSLGGLYDELAFNPPTGLRRLQFRSLSLPPESQPPH